MGKVERPVRWETSHGDRVSVGELTVTPLSQALSVRWSHGGWLWNRPVGVLVERDGRTERIPIIDVTRAAQIGLYALGALFGVAGLAIWMGGRRRSDGEDV
jgi:hypothetical protein